MIHLDHDALDGFLQQTRPAAGLPVGMSLVPGAAPARPAAPAAAGSVAAGQPPPGPEDVRGEAEETTGAYDLLVIEGALAASSEPSLPVRSAPEEARGVAPEVPGPAAVGMGVLVGVAMLVGQDESAASASGVALETPMPSLSTPSHLAEPADLAEPTGRVELSPFLRVEERPRPRRRWPLMTAVAAGAALGAVALWWALPAGQRAQPVAATETVAQKAIEKATDEPAKVASASLVPIPEPAPLAAPAAPSVPPTPRAEGAMIEMRFPGAFYRNSSHPHEIDAAALGGLVRRFKEECAGATIVVTGHTCALGDARSNRELSLWRARRVGELLVRSGFMPEQLRFVGRGDRQPIADNRTMEGKQQNRRVSLRCEPERGQASASLDAGAGGGAGGRARGHRHNKPALFTAVRPRGPASAGTSALGSVRPSR